MVFCGFLTHFKIVWTCFFDYEPKLVFLRTFFGCPGDFKISCFISIYSMWPMDCNDNPCFEMSADPTDGLRANNVLSYVAYKTCANANTANTQQRRHGTQFTTPPDHLFLLPLDVYREADEVHASIIYTLAKHTHTPRSHCQRPYANTWHRHRETDEHSSPPPNQHSACLWEWKPETSNIPLMLMLQFCCCGMRCVLCWTQFRW